MWGEALVNPAVGSTFTAEIAGLQEAMERLMVGRTALVIAHRLSTVRALDRILVFERGRIVEEGPHEALMRLPGGVYRKLAERQGETPMLRDAS